MLFKTQIAANILRAKCIVAGDSCVGKSAITQVFQSDGTHFPKNYSMTCGVDLVVKSVNIPETSDSVEFYIYDSAGKDIFVDSLQKYWNKPSVLCFIFDVTNEESLQNINKWYNLVRELCKDDICPGVLIGNKTDLKDRRQVTPKSGQEMATKLGLVYLECSAKENNAVEDPFFYLANEWHKLYTDKSQSFKTIT